MEKIDWTKWLPPGRLPVNRTARFKPGQVWAFSCFEADTRWFDPIVFRVPADWKPGYRVEVIERPCYPGSRPFISDGRDAQPTSATQCCLLIQDVGQAAPTSPEILYGEPKTKETEMNYDEDFDWKDYLEPRKIAREAATTFEVGATYLFVRSNVRGILRLTHTETNGDVRGVLLARDLPTPALSDMPSWPVGVVCSKFYMLKNSMQVTRLPVEDLFGDVVPVAHKRPAPATKPKGVREVSVDGQQYIDYDKMGDSDPFEKYPYHRVRMPDGTFPVNEKPVMVAPPMQRLVCAMGLCNNSGPFSREGQCFSCYAKEEEVIATKTATMQRGRGASVTRVHEYAPVQSHSMLWGGVFSLRE